MVVLQVVVKAFHAIASVFIYDDGIEEARRQLEERGLLRSDALEFLEWCRRNSVDPYQTVWVEVGPCSFSVRAMYKDEGLNISAPGPFVPVFERLNTLDCATRTWSRNQSSFILQVE